MPRRIRILITWCCAIFALLLVCSFAVSALFEDEIKEKVSEAINAKLRAPFSSENMELSLFKTFPNASIHLEKVLVKEALPEKVFADTLLFAEDLFMQFSILNLISGDVTINEISANQVVLKPGVDEDGTPNYDILIPDSSSSNSTIDLNQIELIDLVLSYNDLHGEIQFAATSEELTLAGLFNNTGNKFDILGELTVDSLAISNARYITQLETELELSLLIPESKFEFLKIKDGLIVANGTPLKTNVLWNQKGKQEHIAVQLKGNELDLEGTASLIPEFGQYLIDNYGIEGIADLDLLYAGRIDGDNNPHLDVQLVVRDGKLKERNTGVSFTNVEFEGGFSLDGEGELNALSVRKLIARAGKGSFKGNMELAGSKYAKVSGAVKSNIDLGDLLHFARYEGEVEGKLDMNTTFSGSMNIADGFSKNDMRQMNIGGAVKLEHASFQLAGMRHGFENMYADLTLDGPDAVVKSMRARLIEDDILLEGKLKGLVNYLLFDNQTLEIDARVTADHIDLEKAISTNEENGDNGTRELSLPNNINAYIQLKLAHLDYASFKADKIIGTLTMNNGVLLAKPIAFQTSDGNITGEIQLNTNSSAEYPLTVYANLKNIDINQLFVQFDEFGQDFITSNHLKGTVNAIVSLNTLLARDMHINKDALRSTMKVSIANGELIAHQPMIDISNHVRNNALYAAFIRADELEQKLKHIKFEELTNTIRIENRKVIIPQMEVNSTVMNVTIAGEHGFDDRIDHHIRFRLADLLTKKNKDAEFGEVIDDGTGTRIFLRMHGTADNLQISNDKTALAEYRKVRRQDRNQELKNIIKNQFNGKGKDTPKDDAKNGPTFNVAFDDNDEEASKPKKKKKGLGKFLKKDPEKEEKTVSFSIEQ